MMWSHPHLVSIRSMQNGSSGPLRSARRRTGPQHPWAKTLLLAVMHAMQRPGVEQITRALQAYRSK
jgi:hypothetical protein